MSPFSTTTSPITIRAEAVEFIPSQFQSQKEFIITLFDITGSSTLSAQAQLPTHPASLLTTIPMALCTYTATKCGITPAFGPVDSALTAPWEASIRLSMLASLRTFTFITTQLET